MLFVAASNLADTTFNIAGRVVGLISFGAVVPLPRTDPDAVDRGADM